MRRKETITTFQIHLQPYQISLGEQWEKETFSENIFWWHQTSVITMDTFHFKSYKAEVAHWQLVG